MVSPQPERNLDAPRRERSPSVGRFSGDRGTAVVEFTVLGLVLLVPVVYAMMSVLAVQRAALGVTAAARDAARVYATAAAADREPFAVAAASLALADQGLQLDRQGLHVACVGECVAGGLVEATVEAHVDLPLLPRVLSGSRGTASVAVFGRHSERIDAFRSVK